MMKGRKIYRKKKKKKSIDFRESRLSRVRLENSTRQGIKKKKYKSSGILNEYTHIGHLR